MLSASRILILGLVLAVLFGPIASFAQTQAALTEVYHNDDFQLTGVTVSKTGRLFVNFPRWSDRYLNAVIEIGKDGSEKPFPDEDWNRWDSKPETAAHQFVCVQSVVVDDGDMMWVVDPGAPFLGPVVAGAPKLVKIDLNTNRVSRTYLFDSTVVQPSSYLNDVRIDNRRNVAYMTDSGVGGIVIVDLETGKAHRALDGDASVRVEPGVSISVNGKAVTEHGKAPQFNSDGIALSPNGEYLYYQVLTGSHLHRIKTRVLRDSPASASAAVELVRETFPLDGLWMDKRGVLFMGNLNESAVYRLTTGQKLEKVAESPHLQWPDTFTQGPDGKVYITSSHINDMPRFNQGKSTRTEPYRVFTFQP